MNVNVNVNMDSYRYMYCKGTGKKTPGGAGTQGPCVSDTQGYRYSMVVRFVCVFRVLVCARVSRACPVRVPAPRGVFLPVQYLYRYSTGTTTRARVTETPKINGRGRERPQPASAFVSFVREQPSTDARSAEAVPAPRLESRGRAGRQICCGARDGIGSININVYAHFEAHAPEGFHAWPRTLRRRAEARRVH